MASSVVDQNKRLSEAAKTPRDTSGNKQESNKLSAKISADSRKHTVTESKAQVTRSSGKQVKGSFEGYGYARSTVLQFNGSGYASKQQQSARYNKAYPSASNGISLNSFTSSKNYGTMNNYTSMTTPSSSSERLSKIVKANQMF
jgi:hypothetical protein